MKHNQKPSLSPTQYERLHDGETDEDHLSPWMKQTVLTQNQGATELERLTHRYAVEQAQAHVNPLGSFWLTGKEFLLIASILRDEGRMELFKKFLRLCDYAIDQETGDITFTEKMLHPKDQARVEKKRKEKKVGRGGGKVEGQTTDPLDINTLVSFYLRVDNTAWHDLAGAVGAAFPPSPPLLREELPLEHEPSQQ